METGDHNSTEVCVVGCWTKTGPRSWSASSSSRTLPCRPHHHLHPAVQPKPKFKVKSSDNRQSPNLLRRKIRSSRPSLGLGEGGWQRIVCVSSLYVPFSSAASTISVTSSRVKCSPVSMASRWMSTSEILPCKNVRLVPSIRNDRVSNTYARARAPCLTN
jgi:hypothetical protein